MNDAPDYSQPIDPVRRDRDWEKALRYYQENSLDAAEKKCVRLTHRYPDHPLPHWMAASTCLAGRRHREAVDHALAATSRAELLTQAERTTLIWNLALVGEQEAAAGLLREAGSSEIRDDSRLIERVRQAIVLEQYSVATDLLDGAGQTRDLPAMAQVLKGNLFKYAGDFESAREAYRRALASEPRSVLAMWSLTQVSGLDGARDRIRALLALAALSGLNPDGQSHLHYALFSEFDRLDDVDRAWKHLKLGSELRQQFIRFDGNAEALAFAQLKQTYDADFLSRMRGDSQCAPIFVVGLPRTGTTLLEQLLGRHPSILPCGELADLSSQFKWCCNYTVPNYMDQRAATLCSTIDHALLGQRFEQKTRRLQSGRAHILDKNPENFNYVGTILAALPCARIIHLQRSPMDSCFSNLKEIFGPQAYTYSYRFEDLAAHYQNYVGLMDHWRSVAGDRMLDVTYESLVTNPDFELARILEFCSLDPAPITQLPETSGAMVATASSVQVRQPIHQRSVGGWKRYASQLEPLRRMISATGLA